MIFCKKCGCMLDDDAKFCTECGTATSDDTQNNGQTTGDPNQVPPYNGQGYGYPPYGGYPPPPYGYYPPRKRPINVGLLVFTIINFFMVGVLALWPLFTLLKARDAQNDVEEAYQLEKAKNANVVCLVIGIIIELIFIFAESAANLLG